MQDIGSSSSVTERIGDITLEMCPLSSEAHSSNGASNISEHISSATSLVVTEKRENKAKEDTVNAMTPVRNTSDVVIEDEDQLFTQLLVAKTEKNNLMQDELFKMSAPINQTKTTVPDITDEENDNLLEELLAQPI